MAVTERWRPFTDIDTQIVALAQRRPLPAVEEDQPAQLALTASAARQNQLLPALNLPVEITAEIFAHCLPPQAVDYIQAAKITVQLFPTNIPKITPCVLASTCRAWRDVALASPSLWSALHLRFKGIPEAAILETGLVESFIDQWYDHAGQHPLSLAIHHASREEDATEHFTPTRMRTVIEHYAPRLRYLELDMSELSVRRLDLCSVHFPQLAVAVFGCKYGSDPNNVPPIKLFRKGQAPRFHDLRLGSSLGVGMGNFTISWSQLTKFQGPIYNMMIFRRALNLTEVAFYLVANPESEDSDDSEPTAGTPITHKKLRSLAFTSSDTDDVMKQLTLPALQSLDISRIWHDNETHGSLEPFLIRSKINSSFPLLSLSVRAHGFRFDDWHQWIAHVGDTVENFELKSASQVLLSTLFAPSGNLSLLPNLRTLHITSVRSSGVPDYPQLVRFLGARSHMLRSFRLDWNVPFTQNSEPTVAPWAPDISGQFLRILNAGMDIYIGTAEKNLVLVDRVEAIS
ncbi:hypothetical protein C8R47DRAFT_1216588 [Mycena vitilis]|nr:hypothetical protein C8R47DRAFT_1216588 [Mycena vitilis]